MLDAIKEQLTRVGAAAEIYVALDDEYEPETGTLVAVQYETAEWHLLPETLLGLLRELPDGGGAEAVHQAIECKADPLWHGPAPREARGTSR